MLTSSFYSSPINVSLRATIITITKTELAARLLHSLGRGYPFLLGLVQHFNNYACDTWFRQIWVAVYAVTERLTAGITTAMLDMVTRTESAACAVFAWFRRTFKALCVVTEVMIAVVTKLYQNEE